MDFQQLNKTYKRWKVGGFTAGLAIGSAMLFGPNMILSFYIGYFSLWPQAPLNFFGSLFALVWCFGILKNKAWLVLLSLIIWGILTAFLCIIDVTMLYGYLKEQEDHHVDGFGLPLVAFGLPLTALYLLCCIAATVFYDKIEEVKRRMELPGCGVVAPV